MKILAVEPLAILEVKSIRFARFSDDRGYFTETWRREDLSGVEGLGGLSFVQGNESRSLKGVARGFHFQWDPPQGKLVRVVHGRMIDLAIDLRRESASFGRVVGKELASRPEDPHSEWIWIPPGFGHGVLFLEDSVIEYLCTAPWRPEGEGAVSLFSDTIEWSLCDGAVREKAVSFLRGSPRVSDKDRRATLLSSLGPEKGYPSKS